MDFLQFNYFLNTKKAVNQFTAFGGDKGIRTLDPLRARQVLSQLSYGPNFYKWSGRQDLNLRPPGPKPGALPSCATSRKKWRARQESNPQPLDP